MDAAVGVGVAVVVAVAVDKLTKHMGLDVYFLFSHRQNIQCILNPFRPTRP